MTAELSGVQRQVRPGAASRCAVEPVETTAFFIFMRRKFYWLLILVVLYAGFRIAANHLLGMGLQTAFSNGTGCAVGFSDPKLSFWPLKGTVKNVSIVSPSDDPNGGFRADEISVRLNLGGLWSKELLLEDLRLEGARVDSTGADSGFYETLKFLFADRPKPTGGASFFFSDWHIHIPKISIFGTPGLAQPAPPTPADAPQPVPRLRLQHGPVNLIWEQVVVIFAEPHASRIEPYDFTAAGSNFRLQLGGTRPVPFGELGAEGRIGQGIVVFNQAQLAPFSSRQAEDGAQETRVAGTGTIYLGDRDEYELSLDAQVAPETLAELDRRRAGIVGELKPHLSVGGSLGGKLDSPHFNGSIRLQTSARTDSAAVAGCLNGELSAELDFNSKRAALSNIGFAPDSSLASIEVRFEEHFPYSLVMQATPEKIEAIRRRCRPAEEAAGRLPVQIAQKLLDVDLHGDISPLSIHGRIDADGYPLEPIVALFEALGGLRPQLGPVELLPSSEFDAHGNFEVDPAGKSSSGALEMKLKDLLLLKTPLRSAGAELRFEQDKIEVVHATAAGDLGQIEVKGTVPFEGSLNLSGTVDGLALQALPQVAEALPLFTTSGAGTFDISGPKGEIAAQAALKLAASSLDRPDRVWQSKIDLKSAKGRLSGAASMFGNSATAQFDLPLDPQSQEQTKITVKALQFPIGEIVSYYSAKNQSVENASPQSNSPGELTGEMVLTAPRNDLLAGTGKLTIQTFKLDQSGIPMRNTRPLTVLLQNGRAVVSDFEIAAAERAIRLTGYVDHKSGWNVTLAGAWELASLIPPIAGIEQMSGQAEAALEIRGAIANPEVSGKFSVTNGSLSFPLGSNIYGVEQAKIEGGIDKNRVTFSSIQGRFGDGMIQGSGTIEEPFSADRRSAEVLLRFDGLQLEPADNLAVNLAGDLQLTQTGTDPLVIGGKIDVKNAQYQNNIDLLQMIRVVTRYLTGGETGAKGRVFRASSAASSSVVLNLDVVSNNSILIDTDIVQAELRAALRVSGPVATPLVDGEFVVADGQFGFKANQFEILVGQIIFNSASGKTDPRLNILGETTLATRSQEEHRISLLIQGTLSNPQVTFSSDRGLSSSEIVGLLGLGSNISKKGWNKGADRSIAELLNPISGISLSDRVAGLTGLRNIRIETGISPETGEVEPQVHASKPLFDKLVLDLQSNLTGRTSAADVDYRLTPFLSLITGWKSYSATELDSNTGGFSLGLRYRDTFPGLRLFPRSVKQSRESRRGE